MSEEKGQGLTAWWHEHGRWIVADESHKCQAMAEMFGLMGRLEAREEEVGDELRELLYGHAITRIDSRRGYWWAHNEEYSTVINFCPFCGERLGVIAVGDPIACEVCGEMGKWVILDRESPAESPRGGRCREHEPPWVD